MNFKFLLLLFTAASLFSCSTAYKSGQTPDDVYYSPLRSIEENDRKQEEDNARLDPEERQIRMSTRDRRWRELDDEYEYDRTYTPYNHCTCSPYYYNPYYYPSPLYYPGVTVSVPKNTTPRTTSLASYNNAPVNLNPKGGNPTPVNSTRAYNNSNRNTNYSRKIFNASTPSTESNPRTYTPSSSGSKSSGSSSSSGGSISRPAKRN
jgi:hypothetical protein